MGTTEFGLRVTGRSTGVAAIVDRFAGGPTGEAVSVGSFDEFVAVFGGPDELASVAVRMFFANGGEQAWVCGVGRDPGITMVEAIAFALEGLRDKAFDLLCIPLAGQLDEPGQVNTPQLGAVAESAALFCEAHHATLLLDPPHWITDAATMTAWVGDSNLSSPDVAAYFPSLTVAVGHDLVRVGPSGAIAGLIARQDRERGIWKAPAGTGATLLGVRSVTELSDFEAGELNRAGVNTIRRFPRFGVVAWGARTTAGFDGGSHEWKYLNVRRTAQYIRRSIAESIRWPLEEANDESLWVRVRGAVEDFLLDLHRDGAMAASRPEEAYFVRCDATTTTRRDVDDGVLNVLVGLALLRPAEFVVLHIRIPGEVTTSPSSPTGDGEPAEVSPRSPFRGRPVRRP